MSKTVTVFTNVPDERTPLTLTIQGEVWESVAVEPRNISFGQLTPETSREPLTRTLTVSSNIEQPIELTKVASTSPAFEVDSTIVEPGKKYEVTVTLAGPLKTGNNSGLIELSTSAADAPIIRVPVSATVMPDVDVNPPRMTLPQTIATEVKNQFMVRNSSKTPLKVTDLAATNPAFQVELQEIQPGALYSVQLIVPAGTELSPAGEKITFKTNVESAADMTIPINVKHPPPARPAPPVPPRATTTQPAAPGATTAPSHGAA
jgi:hypothetical protein